MKRSNKKQYRQNFRLATVLKILFFVKMSFHTLVASLTDGSVLNQFFINVSFHILVASLTLMVLF